MQAVADVLTASRVALAVLFPLAGLVYGEGALSFVIVGIIVGWTTDVIDGPIAHLATSHHDTWWSKHDFSADMLMVFGSFLYMTEIGIIPWWIAILYSIFGGAIIYHFSLKGVTMSLATPLVALPLIVALYRTPFLGKLFLLWIVLALVLDWPRFRVVVREFIEDMGEALPAEKKAPVRKRPEEKRRH